MWPFTSKRAKTISLEELQSGVPSGVAVLEDAARTAAMETAASMWSNAFASASGPLPADCLAWLGRELILRGQGVLLIDTSMGRLRFIPVWFADIDGYGPFPEQWTYRCTVNSPDDSRTVRVSGDGVIHLCWATDPVRPWRGKPPWDTTTGATLGSVEGRLRNEAKTPYGYILPYRDRRAAGSPTDEQAEERSYQFKDLQGRLITAAGTPDVGQSSPGNPQHRFTPTRLGFQPPSELTSLRKDIERSVLSTCMIPESLVSDADGTSQRESYRRFVVMAVEPVLRRLSTELQAKLELSPAEASFDVHALHGHDIAGRAKAFQTLVAGGKDPSEASMLAGLMVPDET